MGHEAYSTRNQVTSLWTLPFVVLFSHGLCWFKSQRSKLQVRFWCTRWTEQSMGLPIECQRRKQLGDASGCSDVLVGHHPWSPKKSGQNHLSWSGSHGSNSSLQPERFQDCSERTSVTSWEFLSFPRVNNAIVYSYSMFARVAGKLEAVFICWRWFSSLSPA